jgi:hypothetical protein
MTATLALVMALEFLAGGASAAGPVQPTENTPGPDAAEALFQRGVAAYDARAYPQAIESFKAAYALSKAPAILFDLAQTHRASGDCGRARETFDAFIAAAAADDPLLPRARARRQEMQLCADAAAPSPTTRALVVPAPSGASQPAPVALRLHDSGPSSQSHFLGRPWGTVCVSTVTGAFTLGAIGAALGLSAASQARTVEGESMWGPEAQRADNRGRAFSDVANVTLLVAGAVAVAGAAVCGVAWNVSHRASTLDRQP